MILFIYGTLRDPQVQTRLFGRTLSGKPDSLSGYTIVSVAVEGRQFPNLAPSAGGKVEGEVIELNEADLRRADGYETAVYSRRAVLLESGRSAYAYIS